MIVAAAGATVHGYVSIVLLFSTYICGPSLEWRYSAYSSASLEPVAFESEDREINLTEGARRLYIPLQELNGRYRSIEGRLEGT